MLRRHGRPANEASHGSVKLTPADAFDLIRWLARSQSDPRKAVAELVQSAIDARNEEIPDRGATTEIPDRGCYHSVSRSLADREGPRPAAGRFSWARRQSALIDGGRRISRSPVVVV